MKTVCLAVAASLWAASGLSFGEMLLAHAEGVRIDFSRTAGPVKPVNGVGQPPMLGQPGDWKMMHYLKEAGIPYSRLHDVGGRFGGGLYVDIPNLFPDFDADEDDPKNYRFVFTDALLKALVENGVEPFFRLGVTIENFATRGFPAQRIYPPKDFAKWGRICEHVIRHYTEGWADGFRLKIAHWEIWNEPDFDSVIEKNAMWRGTFDDFLRFYGTVAPYLKAKFPSLKIGGFGSCGFYAGVGSDYEPPARCLSRLDYHLQCAHRFLAAARENKWPLDFFSYHSYADAPEALRQVAYADGILSHYGFTREKTERVFDEWLPCLSHEGLGTAKQAAQIAAELIGLQNGPCDVACIYDAKCGVGDFSPLFNPMTRAPHKAYYVFKAFNELRKLGTAVRPPETPVGVYVAAATDGEGRFAVLVANISDKVWRPDFVFDGAKVVSATVVDVTRTYVVASVPTEISPDSVWILTLAELEKERIN